MTRNIKDKWVTLKRIMYGNILLLKSSRRFHIMKKKKKTNSKIQMFLKRPTKFKDSENSKLSQCKFRYCRFMCKLKNQKIMSLEFIETKQKYICIHNR